MPHEQARPSAEGTCRCSWCFQRMNYRECSVYNSNYLCPDCSHRIKLGNMQRCHRCKDAFALKDLVLHWKTGEWFCRVCWKHTQGDENIENEFFKRLTQEAQVGEPRK